MKRLRNLRGRIEPLKRVVAAFRAVARSGLVDLDGVPKSRYLLGPNTLAKVSEGEIELLRDRAVLSLYLKIS